MDEGANGTTMNIVMLTNTYLPHVGGVAHSVAAFASEYRRRGHRVLIVAPEFENQPAHEPDVIRVPAIQRFNGSDFSAPLPAPGLLKDELDVFHPDVIHAHHPYLLGMTAMRIARQRRLPLVFTYHTRYEEYTHYVGIDFPVFRRFVNELCMRYANLADLVFAPSRSIARILRDSKVVAPIEVVPTGVDVAAFANGDGAGFRRRLGIPQQAFVVGHLGRLAPEKNLEFLTNAVRRFLESEPRAHFLLAGEGPSASMLRTAFTTAGMSTRLHQAGLLHQPDLADAYHAMDVFAFASKSETQGMVLSEAMAAGVPVVGLDAPGVRDIVRDRLNGRLVAHESVDAFVEALQWIASRPSTELRKLQDGARQSAEEMSIQHTADKALACYASLIGKSAVNRQQEDEQWSRLVRLLKIEWEQLSGLAAAAGAALTEDESRD